MFNNLFGRFVHAGLPLSFNSPAALIFTAVLNLLLHGCTVSVQFSCIVKGPSNELSHNR